jgi:hypothetical protein
VAKATNDEDAKPLGRLVIEGEEGISTVITGGRLECDVIIGNLAAQPASDPDRTTNKIQTETDDNTPSKASSLGESPRGP